jgi:hypothetical protein
MAELDLASGLLVYGPLGASVIALVYAVLSLYRRLSDLASEHAAALDRLHTRHAEALTQRDDRHASALKEIVAKTNEDARASAEANEKLVEVLERLGNRRKS